MMSFPAYRRMKLRETETSIRNTLSHRVEMNMSPDVAPEHLNTAMSLALESRDETDART